MPAKTLDPAKIAEAVERLTRRVAERFPDAGLLATIKELAKITESAPNTIEKIHRPIRWLRALVYMLILFVIAGVGTSIYTVRAPEKFHFIEFVQGVEAAINDIVLISAGIYFLSTAETRIKRRKILANLQELRAIAHVIDMQQLTKDPGRRRNLGRRTRSSPSDELSLFELSRYLDYCSEALSLSGKLAALYAQNLNDEAVIAAVNEIEDLTNGISSKVWQKLMIVHQMSAEDGA